MGNHWNKAPAPEAVIRIKLLKFKLNDQTGTSLVELMISVALIAMISTLATNFYVGVERDEREDRARAAVRNEASVWTEVLERDLKLREIPASGLIPPLSGGRSIDIWVDRLTPFKSGPGQGIMNSHYYTYCQDITANASAKYQNKFGKNQLDFSVGGLNNLFGSGHNFSCMRHLNCGSGRYPQVVMTLYNHQNKQLPSYPTGHFESDGAFRAVLPQMASHKSTADRVVAAALCYEPGPNNSDRFTLEMAMLENDTKLRIDKKQITLPRLNTAKLQVLP